MLGQILNELAQVEQWLTDGTKGHEHHDPTICMMGNYHAIMREFDGQSPEELSGDVVFAMLVLLRATKSTAAAGNLIVDFTRKMVAGMARDRISVARERARRLTQGDYPWVTRTYDTPN